MRVRILPFWDEIAALTRLREGAGHRIFKGEKGVGSPDKPVNRRDKNVQTWPMMLVRLGLYFLDAVSARIRVRQALRSGADVIIFDRYIFDQFANLNLRRRFLRLYVRAVMRLVPRLDVSYVLDADPAAGQSAQARVSAGLHPAQSARVPRSGGNSGWSDGDSPGTGGGGESRHSAPLPSPAGRSSSAWIGSDWATTGTYRGAEANRALARVCTPTRSVEFASYQ